MAIDTYSGVLEAYWEQGWEGFIGYSVQIEGQPGPSFLQNGDYLTIYAADGHILWEGTIELVSRRNEQHSLHMGIWADTKQAGLTYDQWVRWFVHQPPLRATIRRA